MNNQDFYDIYEACEAVLYKAAIDALDCAESGNESQILHKFLTNQSTKNDLLFDNIGDFKFSDDKRIYKRIMMLIITSQAYLFTIGDIHKEIIEYEDSEIIDFLESDSISPIKIIEAFFNSTQKELVETIIDEYFILFNTNYIYDLECMKSVMQENKLSQLLKINPFAILAFFNNLYFEELSPSERTIQDIINIYDRCSANRENLENEDDTDFMDMFWDELTKHCHNDLTQINNIISYILGNVYENAKIREEDEELRQLVTLFEQGNYNVDEVITYFCDNLDAFDKILTYFIEFNDYLIYGEIKLNREEFIEKQGNVKILRQFNPFYDDEQRSFQQKNSF